MTAPKREHVENDKTFWKDPTTTKSNLTRTLVPLGLSAAVVLAEIMALEYIYKSQNQAVQIWILDSYPAYAHHVLATTRQVIYQI